MSGQFLRLNGEMLNRGDGQGGIFSIVGECLAFDGETITLKAADGVEIQFVNNGGLDLQMVCVYSLDSLKAFIVQYVYE